MLMTQCFRRAVQINASNVATIDGVHRFTWTDVGDRVRNVAGGFKELGVDVGDRIAVLSLNSSRYLETYYAVFWIGAVCVPLNTRWSSDELLHAIQDSEPSVLLCDRTFLETALDLQRSSSNVKSIILMDSDNPGSDNVLSFEALASSYSTVQPTVVAHDALAAIYYTGGTTGRSKG